MLRGQAVVLFLAAIMVVVVGVSGAGSRRPNEQLVAQVATPTPNGSIPWWSGYTPSPIPGAYAGIENAFAAGNVWDTGSLGFGHPSGLPMLQTGKCNFVCFGAPGLQTHHVVAFGSDFTPAPGPLNTPAFTHFGAASNCNLGQPTCPGHIKNQVFGLTLAPSPRPTNSGFYIAVNGQGDVGIAGNAAAGAAFIAGAGNGATGSLPYPPPNAGSLVSHTGTGTGDVLFGSSGSGNYVKCDYGETTSGSLTCGAPLRSVSTGSVAGPVPPCYQNGGASCNSTFHIVKNVTDLGIRTSPDILPCANNTWCTLTNNVISLSSSAVFANNNYSCSLSSFSSTLRLNFTVNAQSTSSFTIQAYNNSGSSISGGTPLDINYVCSGN